MTRLHRRMKIKEMIKQAALECGPICNSYQVQARIKNRSPYHTPGVDEISAQMIRGGYARPTGRKVPIQFRAPKSELSPLGVIHCRQVSEFEILERGQDTIEGGELDG